MAVLVEELRMHVCERFPSQYGFDRVVFELLRKAVEPQEVVIDYSLAKAAALP